MSYQTRLEALEAAIAPQERLVVLIVKDGETNDAALAAYAKRHGIAVTDVRCPVVYLSGADSEA
jgi:predicted nucleic acid-binding protein